MGDIKETLEAAKGILEAVPIYQDAIQPAAKEVGKGLQTVAKVIHVVLAPVAAMVWGYEKISDFLNRALEEKLKDTPPEQIVAPNLAVAGPAVEALRFAANEPALRDMYATLLATSMDAETAQNAHPAFVQIISQMVADEARIFNTIATEEVVNISQISLIRVSDPGVSDQIDPLSISKYVYFIKKSQCTYPDLIPSYIDNLRRLGLIQQSERVWYTLWLRPDGKCDYYMNQETSLPITVTDMSLDSMMALLIDDELAVYKGSNTEFGIFHELVQLTSLGEQFANACVAPPLG